jgi:AraC-like DNA-binding protein
MFVVLLKLWKNRRSVVLTWLVSYMAVLFFPVFMSLIGYHEASKTLKSEIHRANESLLKQMRETIDNQFENIEILNKEITWNPKIQQLMYSNKYANNDYTYDVYEISQDLKLYQSSYGFVDGVYVYWAKGDLVILPGTQRSSRFAYDTLHKSQNISYEQWKTLLLKSNYRGFLPIVRIGEDTVPRKALAYVSSFVTGKNEKPVGTTVIMIDEERLLDTIENLQTFNGGEVLILDKNNKVILSNSPGEDQENLNVGKLTGNSGLIYDRFKGEDAEISYIQSEKSGLKYVSVIPSRIFWMKAEYVRNFTYISILISVLGGVLLTLFFLRRNYHPLRRLVQAVAGQAGLPYERESNEFHFIENVFSNTLDEKEKISRRMKQQSNVLRSNVLARMLKGKLDGNIPVDDSATALGIHFESDTFGVLLFYIKESSRFFERIGNMEANGKLRLLHFIVTNVVEEIAGKNHAGYATEVDDAIVCLINLRGGSEEQLRGDLLRIAEESMQFLMERFHIQLTVSVSGIHHTVPAICKAYQEALDAMEYKLVLGRKEILSYEEIRKEFSSKPSGSYRYPLQAEQQLVNYMKVGDFEKAREMLDGIIRENFGVAVVPVQLAKCLLFNLISTMIKTIGEIGSVEDSLFLSNSQKIDQLMTCESLEEMHERLLSLLREVCEYTASRREHALKMARSRTLRQLVGEIREYVEAHFDDMNLNISTLGEHFEMKPAYLSKLFKEQTGEGLLDYINKVRIGKSKEILGTRPGTLSEVARQVGFSEVSAFIRVFKKYEGITPGKYKETATA